METIINQIELYLNIPYLLTFIVLGYLIKKHFKSSLSRLFEKDIQMVYVVLILAALVAVPYYFCGTEWQKLLFSYALGTSLHETIFSLIEKKFTT